MNKTAAWEIGAIDAMEKVALSRELKARAATETRRRLTDVAKKMTGSREAKEKAGKAYSRLARKLPAFEGMAKTNYGMKKDIERHAKRFADGTKTVVTRKKPSFDAVEKTVAVARHSAIPKKAPRLSIGHLVGGGVGAAGVTGINSNRRQDARA